MCSDSANSVLYIQVRLSKYYINNYCIACMSLLEFVKFLMKTFVRNTYYDWTRQVHYTHVGVNM